MIFHPYYMFTTGPATQPTTDTHDGHYEEEINFDWKRKRDAELLAAKERMRRQIRQALEGNPVEVQPLITPYAEANVPLETVSLDWDAMLEDAATILRMRALIEQDVKRRRAAADDDDFILMVM